jgi:hypothetical protein
MKNKKSHQVSPTFIITILTFVSLLSYFCYNLTLQTGLIPIKKEKVLVELVDTNQIKLFQKDSIIIIKDKEIAKLKEELAKRPDTVYIKLKPQLTIKKIDTTSISRVDSVIYDY